MELYQESLSRMGGSREKVWGVWVDESMLLFLGCSHGTWTIHPNLSICGELARARS